MGTNKRKNRKSSKSSINPLPFRRSADKLMMRFYEPLVIQHILGETRGPRIPREPPDVEPFQLDDCMLLRSFTDSLAYLCDYRKDGATVTAVALESRPAVVFWVAANELDETKVNTFLETTLKVLADLGVSTSRASVEEAKEKIFRLAVEFGMERLIKYRQSLLETLKKYLNFLGARENNRGELRNIP
jgi:hypothetical protein